MRAPKRGRTNKLSERITTAVWTRAAGRCQYPGCNQDLLNDYVSGNYDKKLGFVAHIVADDPGGPRGDEVRSRLLSNDPANLMLLCHPHHRLIDTDDVEGHTEEILLSMKADHERRISIVTSLSEERASHVLRYAANIGSHNPAVHFDQISSAILPLRYPVGGRQTIDIEMRGSSFRDDEGQYWEIERENLRRQYTAKVLPLVEAGSLRQLSVFALAPQPLLIELGSLIGDLGAVEVYQRHRDADNWTWPTPGAPMKFRLREAKPGVGLPALILGLSGTIVDDRIAAVLGKDARVWAIEAENPHNDIIKRREDLSEFRVLARRALDAIKARHGEGMPLHVFPAMPLSAAVEFGRVRMPKADLPFVVYDQNRALGGFREAFRIG